VATPLFLAGAAAAGYAAYLYFTPPPSGAEVHDEAEPQDDKSKRKRGKHDDGDEPVTWGPMIEGGGFGVAAIGRF
jgi:hypothetical protein